jgi:hypothetical protein
LLHMPGAARQSQGLLQGIQRVAPEVVREVQNPGACSPPRGARFRTGYVYRIDLIQYIAVPEDEAIISRCPGLPGVEDGPNGLLLVPPRKS